MAILHANDPAKLAAGAERLGGAYTFAAEQPPATPLLYATVTRDGIVYA